MISYDICLSLSDFAQQTIIQKDTCSSVVTVALFTIARTWKQPKCPSTEEWIKKDVAHIDNGILFSHYKKSEIMPFAVTWIET